MKSQCLDDSITVHVPMNFVVRGGRKTIVAEGLPPLPRTDNTLLKAMARAHRWRKLVEDGTYSSITELAKAGGVNQSYACRLFRLTLLAPTIVNRLLDGKPLNLTLKALLEPLPFSWQAQNENLARH